MACSVTCEGPPRWSFVPCWSDITACFLVLHGKLGDLSSLDRGCRRRRCPHTERGSPSPPRPVTSFRRGDAPLALATDRECASNGGVPQARKTRILILGGGFGGVYTARRLEKLC